jgi:hypothetical protein
LPESAAVRVAPPGLPSEDYKALDTGRVFLSLNFSRAINDYGGKLLGRLGGGK